MHPLIRTCSLGRRLFPATPRMGAGGGQEGVQQDAREELGLMEHNDGSICAVSEDVRGRGAFQLNAMQNVNSWNTMITGMRRPG